jgi:hypothetical protein
MKKKSKKGVIGILITLVTFALIILFSLYWFIPKYAGGVIAQQDLVIAAGGGLVIGILGTAGFLLEGHHK